MTKSTNSEPVTKDELISIVVPLFEEVKGELKSQSKEIKKISEEVRMNSEDIRKNSEDIRKNSKDIRIQSEKISRNSEDISKNTEDIEGLSSKTQSLGILMEQMNNKIDTALEVSELVTEHSISIKSYDKRLDRVETDLQVIKVAQTRSKIRSKK